MTEKIAVLCPSYNRPHLLGQAIAMFLEQDYDGPKEFIALEDSGILGKNEVIEGEGWKVVSTNRRYPSVGAKRNALTKMTDAEFVKPWDDDDTYFPWTLSASVHALRQRPYAQPLQALEWDTPKQLGRYWCISQRIRDKLTRCEPLNPHDAWDFCYGAGWSYRVSEFWSVGGYPEQVGNGDDTEFGKAMLVKYGCSSDTICDEFPDPFYIYSRDMSGSWHASELGPGTAPLRSLAHLPRANPKDFKIQLPAWYRTIQIPRDVKPRKW